jgi:hypothetical protein
MAGGELDGGVHGDSSLGGGEREELGLGMSHRAEPL